MMNLSKADRLNLKGNTGKENAKGLGAAARRALASLFAATYEASSRQWLKKHLLHIQEGRGLHPDCGSGEDTLLIASLLDRKTAVYGIDEDPVLIEAARENKELAGLEHVYFAQARLSNWKPESPYDFICIRIQTAVAPDSDQWLADLARNLKTGGLLLAEMISPSGFQAYPYNHAFARAMELIGRLEADQLYEAGQLPGLLETAGFTDIETTYASPAFISRTCNHIASLSLECYRAEILRRGDSNREELNALLQELRAFEQQEDTLISRSGVLQITAKKNEPSK